MNQENELPRGWVQTTLEEVTTPVRVSVQPTEYPTLPFIGMEHVESENMRLLGTVPASELKSNAVRFWPGDVLYGRLRPYLNKVLRTDFEGLCSAEFLVFPETPNLNSRYLQYFLNSWNFREFASHLNEGDRPRVDWSQLKGFQFPLPPLLEQHRIVAAIEEQFTRLDAAVAALQRAKTRLKRYRAAVLKAAVEGKLTEAWRTEHPTTEPASVLLGRILKERRAKWEADLRVKGKDPGKVRYVEPAVPDIEGLPELPEGWCWATVEQVCERIVDCLHSTPNFKESGFICIDTNCIKPGQIIYEKVRYVDDVTFIDRNRRMKPEENDVIFSREGALLGVAVRVPANLEFCLGQRMMIFRLDRGVDARYYESVINSSVFRSQYLSEITGSASPHLNIQDIRTFAIPLPSFSEQEVIVKELERRMSIVDELEIVILANLKRAERLRQSILREAFTGRLVPQDPNDEPASVLLERIRGERGGEREGERKNGMGASRSKSNKGRAVRVPEPGGLDVAGMGQVELWEGVGG